MSENLENHPKPVTPAKKGGSGRSSEKRRERSKVAARCRRSKESEIFSELAEFLPLPENTRNSLDKASVMRLSLSDLKLRSMMEKVFLNIDRRTEHAEDKEDDDLELTEIVSMLNNAMGGFLLVLSTEGDIIYCSDSITTHLGLSQVEVMGLSIYDFSHPCDHGEIKDLLLVNKKEVDDEDWSSRSSSFRMKCTITARGRNVHLRAASYKVIDFTGRMFMGNAKDPDGRWFVGIGEPLLHPSDVDIPLNKQTFLTKHSPDMKCEYVDDNIKSFLGYNPEDLIGKSIFEFHHASDGLALAKAFKSLYAKGQSVTQRYRFLAKHGGWAWVVTQATLIQSSSSSKPNSIVCLNFITSGIENEGEIMSAVQKELPLCKPIKVAVPDFKKAPFVYTKCEPPKTEISVADKENVLPEHIPESKPITSTKAVIAPRTDDMDSGFLMPLDNDNTLIVSKEEPEDLTHLAPIAGDACVPLDQQMPLLDNLLKELEEANVPFTYNGYEIDVNFDDLPQLGMPVSSSPAARSEIESDETDVCGESSISLNTTSPLFLNSDPPMVSSPGSKSSLLSPFNLSPNPTKSKSSRSDRSNCSLSCSSYEMQPSPSSNSGYEDSRSPLPALIGLPLQEDSFQGPILMDGQLNDPGPSNVGSPYSPLNFSTLPEVVYSAAQPDYAGAFVTLADGRKFPVVPTSNPNEFLWTGDPVALVDQPIKTSVIRETGIASKLLPNAKKSTSGGQGPISSYASIPDAKQNSLLNQLVHSSSTHDAFDGGMKGGGNPLLWNWDSVSHRIRSDEASSNKANSTVYRSSSAGPPLAKSARISCGKGLPTTPVTAEGAPSSPSSKDFAWYGGTDRSKFLPMCSTNDVNVRHATAVSKSKASLPVENRKETGIGTEIERRAGGGPPNEFDLRTCLEQLLATGQGNKVTEIMSWLRNSSDSTNPEGEGQSLLKRNVGLLGVQKDFPRMLLSKVPTLNNRKRNNHGYLLKPGNLSTTGLNISAQQLPGLYELTRQDCEVNAPLTETSRLLNGAELLTALENDNTVDPFA